MCVTPFKLGIPFLVSMMGGCYPKHMAVFVPAFPPSASFSVLATSSQDLTVDSIIVGCTQGWGADHPVCSGFHRLMPHCVVESERGVPLARVMQGTPLVTPVAHLVRTLGPPPSTSLSPSMSPQQQQEHTTQYSPMQLGRERCQMCLSHHQVCWLLEDTASAILI